MAAMKVDLFFVEMKAADMSAKAKKMEQLSSMIVQSLAASIQNLDPIDEICDMLVESSGYRKALYAWRDQHTGLNLLQLAVVSKHLDVVKMFCLEKHKGSFRQTWHGEYYNPLLHLACKVGALNIIRYLVEQQNADMTAEGVVTYPHPTDSNTLSQNNSAVFNSGEIHVFMNRSERNYLRLQGDHEHDISYGAGHSSFLSDDKDPTSCRNKDQPQITSQLPMKCLAGPSTSCSSHQSSQGYSEASIADTSAKLEGLSVGKNLDLISSEDPQLKEAKQLTGQTPYQICVSEGHAGCANYLCVLIISRMEKPIYRIHNSPLLHKVSYLGCAQHLQLLLKHGHQRHINDKDNQGHMPIHIASLTANPECIEVLLKHGASVNSRADHRTCLQIMYWSKFRPENFVLCSEILVRYGMDVNAMDHNNNTALDYLAWELGQKWYQISKAWVKTHRIAEINNYLQPAAHLQEHILSDDQFRQEIFCCMQVLLAAGASTLVISRDGRVDHTIVHTLLQNTGWPLNSSLRKRPMEVYKALDLFFHYGADPNVIARNNNESAMTMLLMHSLHEIPNNLKVKFVALFLMNGANLECLIPEPKQYRENYSDRRWNIYPVMVGLQERHPIGVVKLLYDFMSLRHVYRSLRMTEDKFLWHRMTWSLGGEAKDCKYREQWLAIRIPRVRTLRHCCKISVFKAVGRRAVLIDELPLPRPLKRYLHDTDS